MSIQLLGSDWLHLTVGNLLFDSLTALLIWGIRKVENGRVPSCTIGHRWHKHVRSLIQACISRSVVEEVAHRCEESEDSYSWVQSPKAGEPGASGKGTGNGFLSRLLTVGLHLGIASLRSHFSFLNMSMRSVDHFYRLSILPSPPPPVLFSCLTPQSWLLLITIKNSAKVRT